MLIVLFYTEIELVYASYFSLFFFFFFLYMWFKELVSFFDLKSQS